MAKASPRGKKRKKPEASPERPTPARGAKSSDETPELLPPPERITRHVQPLGPRVLIRIIKHPDRLDSGLFLPKGAKDDSAQALLGQVLEVARTMPKAESGFFETDDSHDPYDLGANVSGIPVEAKVLVAKERGVAVPWDDTLRIVEVRHILAIVDEIPEGEIQ
jgi:co-chaperonin GroES (HSP10)